jgi:pyruvate-ferredoxin/flavodoxin oxidoreductase
VPDFGVYIRIQGTNGDVEYRTISRQLVLFCVERRKAWRMLQSKAGIENREYQAQRSILADMDAGKIPKDVLFARAEELMKERMPKPAPVHQTAASGPRPIAAVPRVPPPPASSDQPHAAGGVNV